MLGESSYIVPAQALWSAATAFQIAWIPGAHRGVQQSGKAMTLANHSPVVRCAKWGVATSRHRGPGEARVHPWLQPARASIDGNLLHRLFMAGLGVPAAAVTGHPAWTDPFTVPCSRLGGHSHRDTGHAVVDGPTHR